MRTSIVFEVSDNRDFFNSSIYTASAMLELFQGKYKTSVMNSFCGNDFGPDRLLGTDTIEKVLGLFPDNNYICIEEEVDSNDAFSAAGIEMGKTYIRMRTISDAGRGRLTESVGLVDCSDFPRLISRGEVDVLTIDKAMSLKGSAIQTYTEGYDNQRYNQVFVVGDIVSEYDYYLNLNEDCYPDRQGHMNRIEEWRDTMSADKLERTKDKMLLLDRRGKRTGIYAYASGDGCFQCSDDDRFTSFVILK